MPHYNIRTARLSSGLGHSIPPLPEGWNARQIALKILELNHVQP
ncbi:hypothetical protein HMPREF3038_02279 [Akkermansia sp. KLE1797]|nr:hypothetical protein HMPREF3038_02279 [Akkermansia sp. KLE1797]KXU53658.1 hypothetical protein HMPREF3039_02190 [Akkermansia sp. KLE1798]KZA03855.1 hypothetical protein HMPREF1326_02395 [Akkermansia sp. KLE1605]